MNHCGKEEEETRLPNEKPYRIYLIYTAFITQCEIIILQQYCVQAYYESIQNNNILN
jgi:hypothetical protein